MVASMLKRLWREVTDIFSASPPLEDCGLHYAWINAETPIIPAGADDPLCHVSLKHFDCAYKNARQYPDTPVSIWVDYRLLDDMSRFFMESHVGIFAPANVRLRDLNEIPAYAQSPVFAVRDPMPPIWPRVDFARLLVLEHALEHDDQRHACYADFDVEDAKMRSPVAARAMERYGMFFGRVNKYFGILENGYMMFSKDKGLDFLREHLIPPTREDAENNDNGYVALKRALGRWRITRNIDEWDISRPRLHEMGYKIPDNALYIDNKIN